MSAKRQTCQHGQYNGNQRCRRRATLAVVYGFKFGERLRMDGPAEPVYMRRVTFRCNAHGEVPRILTTLPIAEYARILRDVDGAA
jgi:hypothetical protein